MSWVATAVIGSAVIGGVASNSAAKKAAKGQERALDASTAGTELARTDINRLFEQAAGQQQEGFSGALNFLGGAVPQQLAPFQAGNVAAQQQLSRGLPQIQAALLGNQLDLSGFQAREIPFQPLEIPQQQAPAPIPQRLQGDNINIGLNRTGLGKFR